MPLKRNKAYRRRDRTSPAACSAAVIGALARRGALAAR